MLREAGAVKKTNRENLKVSQTSKSWEATLGKHRSELLACTLKSQGVKKGGLKNARSMTGAGKTGGGVCQDDQKVETRKEDMNSN